DALPICDQFIPFGVVFCIIEPTVNTICTVLPFFIQCDKADLNIIQRFTSIFCELNDSFYSLLTGLLRTIALSHQLHHKMTAYRADDLFAMSSSCCSPYFVVYIQSRTNNW